VHEVWIVRDVDDEGDDALFELARRRSQVRPVTREQLEARAKTDAPQGVLALADAVVPVDLDVLAEQPMALLVALDGVTDPGNLGAVLRSAETAGATGVLIPKHRSAHLSPAAVKAAAGAVEHVPIAVVPGIPAALEQLRRSEVWVVGLDAGGTSDVFSLNVAGAALALVLGAEGAGLARLTRERCDVIVSIPMRGELESLNVAAAAAVACHAIAHLRS
jgi:23S rRNA (guanosine2251-2'-O)-methyltransferase